MPRSARDVAAGIHHVWVNATGNWSYFVDDVDRIAWVRRFVHVLARHGSTCAAFCQMTTHVHALLSVPGDVLSLLMHDLDLEYAKDFNARHGRVGAFGRKRFGSRRIEGREDLLTAYPYVVLNPVREGLCPYPELWRWSSYATTLGISRDFPFVDASPVLAELGGSVGSMRELVAAAALADSRPAPGGHVRYLVPDVSR